MQVTAQIKLLPTKEQEALLNKTLQEYIDTANSIVSGYLADADARYTSKSVNAELPSALKNQAIQDANSIFKKYSRALKARSKKDASTQKEIKVPVLKKPVAIWNNQNYAVKFGYMSFPVWNNGKSTRLIVKAIITDYQASLLLSKLGTMRITKKSDKYIAQIAVTVEEAPSAGDQVIGVDLGLKIPAVAVSEDGKVRFFGNGRQNKFVKRKFLSMRKNLGKSKNLCAIKKMNNKEQRWMRDKDHKTSRQIVNFAKGNNASVIRLEKLSGIRQTARTSRKNEKNLHTWSFYRLAQFIEYKARLEGILVEYVDPRYTSQTCPACNTRNHAIDRKYKCSCGFATHRDILGARNIISAPVADGNSPPA
ncbi:transposase, IS605 OrfB family [Peptoclostridium acidaminophilum DSM 3953]|uniref:Transposase, IS605 OrfB family n=1 Tax=Peptoclostridium acidaminophilum DSM 3953 TaxID=1286171 RepID=W8T5V1_PEPAC|nr:RNA-guided endonuclease TnpB family protein [Peptoclostridium acidaminophilum]AHM56225.1 transposase, IS605 OrfB family [Peptoclostridium acidaminophilum DSM 3953]